MQVSSELIQHIRAKHNIGLHQAKSIVTDYAKQRDLEMKINAIDVCDPVLALKAIKSLFMELVVDTDVDPETRHIRNDIDNYIADDVNAKNKCLTP